MIKSTATRQALFFLSPRAHARFRAVKTVETPFIRRPMRTHALFKASENSKNSETPILHTIARTRAYF